MLEPDFWSGKGFIATRLFSIAFGTIDGVFGFIERKTPSYASIDAPDPGAWSLVPAKPVFGARGIALQPGRSSPKRSDNPAKDEKGKKDGDKAIGTALRSAYQKTVSEPVPDQMLDLLRKLD